MMKFTFYDPASGVIEGRGFTTDGDPENPASIDYKVPAGQAAFIGEEYDGEDWWMPGGVPTLRQGADYAPLSAPISEGDTRTLTGLPVGALVTVSRAEGDDLSGIVDADGMAEISFAEAGDYHITITADFPFLTSEGSVHVDPIS